MAAVVMSNARRDRLEKWNEKQKCQLPMLMDEDRAMYCMLGRRRSILRNWSLSKLHEAAADRMADKQTDVNYMVYGDPCQLGGDYVFDKSGKLQKKYQTTHPADRVDLETLQDDIHQLHRSSSGSKL